MAGGLMYPENQSFFISLDEGQLRDLGKSNENKEICTDLFINSAENVIDFKNLPLLRDEVRRRIKKGLIICLLENNTTCKLQIKGYDENREHVALTESENIELQISKQLIDAILSTQGSYECSDETGNRIYFYVHDDDSFGGKGLIDAELGACRERYII